MSEQPGPWSAQPLFAIVAVCCLWLSAFPGPGQAQLVSSIPRSQDWEAKECPAMLQPLARRLLSELIPYLQRALVRAGQTRATVIAIGEPDFGPLSPTAILQPLPPLEALLLESSHQVLFTALERRYDGQRHQWFQTYHWAFFAQQDRRWHLIHLYRIEGPHPPTQNPLPAPSDSRKTPLAEAIRRWLQDCPP